MDIGYVSQFEPYRNSTLQQNVQSVSKTNQTTLLNEEVRNRNINNPELVKELATTNNINETNLNSIQEQKPTTTPTIEYVLSNLNFGYNSDSRDFYVKVSRGDSTIQYPTDDMMKLKAYLLELSQQSSA